MRSTIPPPIPQYAPREESPAGSTRFLFFLARVEKYRYVSSKQAPIGAFGQSLGSIQFTLVEGRSPKPGIFIPEDLGEIHFP